MLGRNKLEIRYIVCDICRKKINKDKRVSVRTSEHCLDVDVCNGKCLDKYIQRRTRNVQRTSQRRSVARYYK